MLHINRKRPLPCWFSGGTTHFIHDFGASYKCLTDKKHGKKHAYFFYRSSSKRIHWVSNTPERHALQFLARQPPRTQQNLAFLDIQTKKKRIDHAGTFTQFWHVEVWTIIISVCLKRGYPIFIIVFFFAYTAYGIPVYHPFSDTVVLFEFGAASGW